MRDRIVVVGERALEYKIYSPDPETFVLSLEGAAIDPDAAVRITPEGPGPVSLDHGLRAARRRPARGSRGGEAGRRV